MNPKSAMLFLALVCCFVAGCAKSSSRIEEILSRHKTGDEEAPLLKELNLSGQPCFNYPNMPFGEDMTDYFLPDGDVRVRTRLAENGKVVLASDPFFIEDKDPIEDRVKRYDKGMEDYAKAHRVPIKPDPK